MSLAARRRIRRNQRQQEDQQHTVAHNVVPSRHSAWSFGYNYFHQLGPHGDEAQHADAQQHNQQEDEQNNNPNFICTPTRIRLPAALTKDHAIGVAASNHASFILTSDGRVHEWGTLFSMPVEEPTRVRLSVRVTSITCGARHAAAISRTGQLFTWGCGYFGRLGHGNEASYMEPRRVEFSANSDHKVTSVACGGAHTLASTAIGVLFAWGYNRYGQCGLGRAIANDVHAPTAINLSMLNLETVSSIECGRHHSAFVTSQGKLYTWGLASEGRLGHDQPTLMSMQGKFVDTPREVAGLAGVPVASVALGTAHSVALTRDSRVVAFGNGEYGRLGVGDRERRNLPHLVHGFSDKNADDKVIRVGASACSSYAITTKGNVYTWGLANAGAGFAVGDGFDSDNESEAPTDCYLVPKLMMFADGVAVPDDLAGERERRRSSVGSEQSCEDGCNVYAMAMGEAHAVCLTEIKLRRVSLTRRVANLFRSGSSSIKPDRVDATNSSHRMIGVKRRNGGKKSRNMARRAPNTTLTSAAQRNTTSTSSTPESAAVALVDGSSHNSSGSSKNWAPMR